VGEGGKVKDISGMKPKTINRWSYSAWSVWKSCRFKYFCSYILGIKDDAPSYYLERGIEIHKQAEAFLKGEIKQLPPALRKFRSHYAELRKLNPVVEEFWGVTKEWKPAQRDSWVVMKMDAAVLPSKKTDGLLIIQDLKTGREYDSHLNQAGLYAAIGYALHPKAKAVETEFWYSDHGTVSRNFFDRRALKKQVAFWLSEGASLLKKEKKYLPSPSEYGCKYCHLRSDKGGPCLAWKSLKKGNS